MAEQTIKTYFQVRRGQSSQWKSVNPVLRAGEPGFALDTFEFKIGNGSLHWNDLPLINGNSTISLIADGNGIVIENDVIQLFGLKGATAGQIPRKGVNGKLEWYFPVTQDDIDSIKDDIKAINDKLKDVYTKTEVDNKFKNVYTKAETDAVIKVVDDKFGNVYTKKEVDDAIKAAVDSVPKLGKKKVNSVTDIDLTAPDAEDYIYFVPNASGNNDEYMVIDGTLEFIGNTKTDLTGYVKEEDLDDYVKTTDLDTKLEDYVKDTDLDTKLGDYVESTDFTPVKNKVGSLPDKIISKIIEVKQEATTNTIKATMATLQADGTYTNSDEVIITLNAAGDDGTGTTVAGLLSAEDKKKIETLSGTSIKEIDANGTKLDIISGVVNIPIATDKVAGIVKNLDDTANKTNAVSVKIDGTMEVEDICVDKLVNSKVNILVLDGGNATV